MGRLNEHGTNTLAMTPENDTHSGGRAITKTVYVRVPPALHPRIERWARAKYTSVNKACVDVLEHAVMQFERTMK